MLVLVFDFFLYLLADSNKVRWLVQCGFTMISEFLVLLLDTKFSVTCVASFVFTVLKFLSLAASNRCL